MADLDDDPSSPAEMVETPSKMTWNPMRWLDNLVDDYLESLVIREGSDEMDLEKLIERVFDGPLLLFYSSKAGRHLPISFGML